PAAERQKRNAQQGDRYPVPLADKGMELVFAEIRNIREQGGRMVVQRAPGHDPAHVRPEAAIARRIWIAFHVSILVMHTVRRYPEKRAAFQRQCGADGKEIFHPFVSLESSMREQTVISNADSQASGNPPKQQGGEKAFPGEHEERGNRAYMECA